MITPRLNRTDLSRRNRVEGERGFTLIELMITVAIIGVLAAVAYPLYLDKVREARRVDAKSALLRAANSEERYYAVKNEYTSELAKLGVEGVTDNNAYAITISVPGTGLARKNNQIYEIAATAINDQANDICQTMTIDQTGKKAAWTGLAADKSDDVSNICW